MFLTIHNVYVEVANNEQWLIPVEVLHQTDDILGDIIFTTQRRTVGNNNSKISEIDS